MNRIFTPVSLDGQTEYNRLLAMCAQKASDYSFVNLWGWGREYGLEWSFCEGYVLIRQTIPDLVYWAPVGDWAGADWKALKNDLPQDTCFSRIPEELKNIWEARLEGVRVRECREHWDYLYDRAELTELKGRKFHNKKNLLNQFVREYDATFVELDEKTVECALAMQTDWFLWRNSENDRTLEAENRAIVKVMHDWSRLGSLMGGGIVVYGTDKIFWSASRPPVRTPRPLPCTRNLFSETPGRNGRNVWRFWCPFCPARSSGESWKK